MSTLEGGCGLTFKVGEIVEGNPTKHLVPVSFTCDYCKVKFDLSVDFGLLVTPGNSEEVESLISMLLQSPDSTASQNLKKVRANIVMNNCRLLRNLR